MQSFAELYLAQQNRRTQLIVERRGARTTLDPFRPYHFLVEPETGPDRRIANVATIFLTNRECPWHCVMCDLWKNTLPESVQPGAIPAQITYALERLPKANVIKLYNSGSFFDPLAIPPEDYEAIATLVRPFDRLIVECHPSLLRPERVQPFQKLLGKVQLEIAIGLESSNEHVLSLLNKKMSTIAYAEAAKFLQSSSIDLRTFLLVPPPFLPKPQALDSVRSSLDFAFEHNSAVVALIPLRTGNGALDELRVAGLAPKPAIFDLETLLEYGLRLQRGRVFADVWDLSTFSNCDHCFADRQKRLQEMNLHQQLLPSVTCKTCA